MTNGYSIQSASGAIRNPEAACTACVVIPARNEEDGLAATLHALRVQVGLDHQPLDPRSYEVLLLLNNCSDGSLAVAQAYAATYPDLRLCILEASFAPEQAHVGTARRLLMDLACERLEAVGGLALLSTDADTLVAPDWIAQNLAAIAAGAEVVGGVIHLFAEDYASLTPEVRTAYDRDRSFQALVARLESLLDPDDADPWPRHLEHFGASLACTPAVYRRCGGMPPVKPLEDVAFIDALRKVGAHIRHAPDVHISTSARLDGRAEVGLSGQLRHWQRDAVEGRPHDVPSAAALEHRFRTLAGLRAIHAGAACTGFPEAWQKRIRECAAAALDVPLFLERVDCNRLIEETFAGAAYAEIQTVLADLERAITRIECEQHLTHRSGPDSLGPDSPSPNLL